MKYAKEYGGLKHIDLSGNRLGDVTAKALAGTLRADTYITGISHI
jgi:hypothetical protein